MTKRNRRTAKKGCYVSLDKELITRICAYMQAMEREHPGLEISHSMAAKMLINHALIAMGYHNTQEEYTDEQTNSHT